MEKKREKSFYFPEKILKWKRLLLTLLIVGVIHISSMGLPQPSSFKLELNHTSLIEIFNSIKKQSNYTFLYSVEDVEKFDDVSISNTNANIQDILEETLKGTNLEYKIKDNVIIVKPSSQKQLNTNTNQEKDTKKISGVISDESGETLPGVSVVIKGTSTGVSTDFDGKYEIEVPIGSILIFSFVGMDPKEVKITNQSSLDIVLNSSAEQLNEVTVVVSTGYQKIDRKLFAGSATKLKGKMQKLLG